MGMERDEVVRLFSPVIVAPSRGGQKDSPLYLTLVQPDVIEPPLRVSSVSQWPPVQHESS
jgi:hypothetical protein